MGITDITTIAIYHIVQWITLILYWFGINKFADTTSKIASKSVEIGKKCAGSSITPNSQSCILSIARKYDYSGGLVDVQVTEKNFKALKKRKYSLLILCFCTSLCISILNYTTIKDFLEKLNQYSVTISWINVAGNILWIPFEMVLIGPLNVIICETGVNNCIKYSTLAIKSWQKRLKTEEIKAPGMVFFCLDSGH